MQDAKNLRRAERYLLAPPLAATFGAASVALCDISATGARFRHDGRLETGSKSILKIAAVQNGFAAVSLEAMVVWSQTDAAKPGWFVSGIRTYSSEEILGNLIQQLQAARRTSRIEELRSTDRFYLSPPLGGTWDGRPVQIEDISARGARVELASEPLRGSAASLTFRFDGIEVNVAGEVMWTAVKAISGSMTRSFRAGLLVNEKPELMRLAIGRLCEAGRAALDTRSLGLKLRVLRARARQLAPGLPEVDGIPAEQYLLIQGVREELRLNPEEALHWYRRARLVINDPATRTLAPPIANHPDALAVWEYLERSVDPSIVGKAFRLPI